MAFSAFTVLRQTLNGREDARIGLVLERLNGEFHRMDHSKIM